MSVRSRKILETAKMNTDRDGVLAFEGSHAPVRPGVDEPSCDGVIAP